MSNPVVARSVDELVAQHVRPGMHLHFAVTMARPNALINAVARAFYGTGALTVSMASVHSSAHALALSGAVQKMITCFLGETYPTPRPCPLYRDILTGTPYELELWSLLTFVQRLMAGATGQPSAATSSLLGTHLADGKNDTLTVVRDPWSLSGRPTALLRPLRPDITVVHGVCADRRGNVVLLPPHGEGAWAAFAAKKGVIASVERIVEEDVIAWSSERVLIPGQRVIGLCESPHGAHPQSLRTDSLGKVHGYLDDYQFLADTADACRDPHTARAWFREWVDLPGGHAEYLERLGGKRLVGLALDTPPPRRAPDTALPVEPTRSETLIILGVRAVMREVRTHGYDTVLAGIGASHMAAWLAAEQLRLDGVDVALVAELGFYGVTPCHGDVFLFSQRHTRGAQQLAGIPEALGGLVASNERCLGVLAAAEIDTHGNINTSVLPDGRWITGSGGAHDIAASADCVVVAPADPRRYVRRVAAVTSPGHRVRTVVSEFGAFRREHADDPFRLTTFLSREGGPATPGDAVTTGTDWQVDYSETVPEEPITNKELALLRSLDPEGHYR
ncbi:acetate CoA-transferase [Candidatus Protofrankia californiensis]|uniref:Acetate CoA-transferase n=1 Tax=Candidatus Protofrankia californiensis TaxID=1839754 RepID=A0A1C3P4U6_9ACTN|nr:acetate CoA-transferase [Candidatus Protofrankia californiensis]